MCSGQVLYAAAVAGEAARETQPQAQAQSPAALPQHAAEVLAQLHRYLKGVGPMLSLHDTCSGSRAFPTLGYELEIKDLLYAHWKK